MECTFWNGLDLFDVEIVIFGYMLQPASGFGLDQLRARDVDQYALSSRLGPASGQAPIDGLSQLEVVGCCCVDGDIRSRARVLDAGEVVVGSLVMFSRHVRTHDRLDGWASFRLAAMGRWKEDTCG